MIWPPRVREGVSTSIKLMSCCGLFILSTYRGSNLVNVSPSKVMLIAMVVVRHYSYIYLSVTIQHACASEHTACSINSHP